MMRLSHIEISGFRGVSGAQEPLKVPIPPGFLVVSGRNGAGKSTIFDAFEFALIGEISKFPVLKEGQESARDYYWWRGQGDVGPKYVSLIFEGADGSSFPLTRKPEDRPEDRDRTFAGAACNMPVTDGDPISALVRTSLIRDETITAFGLDLTEIQRFSFVQSALNLERGTRAVESVRQAREIAKRRLSDAQTSRARLQEELNQRLTQLSEARASLAKEDEITESLKRLQLLLGRKESDVSTILQYSHHSMAHWRVMIGNLEVVLERLAELSSTWNDLEKLREQIALTSHAKEEAESQYALSSSTLDKARSNLEVEKRRDALATSLSFLLEYGEQVGLREQHCPLCQAYRTEDEFKEALSLLRREIDERSASLRKVSREFDDSERAAKTLAERRAHLSAELERLRRMLDVHESTGKEAEELLRRAGYEGGKTDESTIQKALENLRERVINVQKDRIVLESSRLLDRIQTIEHEVVEIRAQLEQMGRREARKFGLVERLSETMHVIQRTSGDYVDEKLAELEPLLVELYKRLQPHRGWRTIKYAVRGDVRRMLSLRVGEDALNPVFVFSSGQRRAAGLAFLLSVYAARSWCNVKTLLLDDPVQHIDDFRAVHLVEILAALRKQGHQIICSVEDSALAELLCRRLASSKEGEGMHLKLDQDECGSAIVTGQDWVRPHIYPVLQSLSA